VRRPPLPTARSLLVRGGLPAAPAGCSGQRRDLATRRGPQPCPAPALERTAPRHARPRRPDSGSVDLRRVRARLRPLDRVRRMRALCARRTLRVGAGLGHPGRAAPARARLLLLLLAAPLLSPGRFAGAALGGARGGDCAGAARGGAIGYAS